MDVQSVARKGESNHREHSRCAGCGEPSGKPSEGGKALKGLRNVRVKDTPMYCMDCHPEFMGAMGGAGILSLEATS